MNRLSQTCERTSPGIITRLHPLASFIVYHIFGANRQIYCCRLILPLPRVYNLTTCVFRRVLKDQTGYDILILSDLLYFDASHEQLVQSIELLLSRKATSRVYVAAGMYTPSRVCDNFLQIARQKGLENEELTHKTQTEEEKFWRGELPVFGMSREGLSASKANVRWWLLWWGTAK